MRAKKIILGLSAVAAVAALAACSSGSASGTNTHLDAAAVSRTTTGTTTTAPTTTTTPPATTTPPVTTHAAPPKPVPVPVPGTPCTSSASACADVVSHQAWLIKDGKVVYGPVSMMPGKRGSRTPVGTFSVLYKQKIHYSKEFNNAPMPNSVFFYPGDAFHEGNVDDYSNGCIHLSWSASKEFFDFLDVGDQVQIVS